MKREAKIVLLLWLVALTGLRVVSTFPHEPRAAMGWVNAAAALLLAILSFVIFLRPHHRRYIFLNLSLVFLSYALFLVTRFVGDGLVLGNAYTHMFVYQYLSIAMELVFGITVVFIALSYHFREMRAGPVYLMTLAITVPTTLLLAKDFFIEPYLIAYKESYEPLFLFLVKIESFFSAFVLFFWFVYMKTDRPIGQYVNTVMFLLSLGLAFNILHSSAILSNFRLITPLSQYWHLGLWLIFLITLSLKLHSLTSPFGRMYERILIHGAEHFSRQHGYFDRFIVWCFFDPQANERPIFVARRTARQKKKIGSKS